VKATNYDVCVKFFHLFYYTLSLSLPLSLSLSLSLSRPNNFLSNSTDETQQTSTSRNPEFSLNVNSPQSQKISQDEISDLIKDLQLTNNTAEPFIKFYISGIFWMTCEGESISLTAKRF